MIAFEVLPLYNEINRTIENCEELLQSCRDNTVKTHPWLQQDIKVSANICFSSEQYSKLGLLLFLQFRLS